MSEKEILPEIASVNFTENKVTIGFDTIPKEGLSMIVGGAGANAKKYNQNIVVIAVNAKDGSEICRFDDSGNTCESVLFMFIDGREKCPSNPEFGILVEDSAGQWESDGNGDFVAVPISQKPRIPHGTEVQVLDLYLNGDPAFGFSKIKYQGQETYVQSFFLTGQNPLEYDTPSLASHCF